jgi:Rrf2 family iron-sulfur cluster assembly transcriptional regulator
VIALVDVAGHSGSRPVSLADVAERQSVSLSYLEQLFAMLRRAGLVTASRGPGGGYRLQRPAADIRIADVFQAVEEPPAGEPARDWTIGPTAALWTALDDQIAGFLQGVSLADVMNGGPGRPRPNGQASSLSA